MHPHCFLCGIGFVIQLAVVSCTGYYDSGPEITEFPSDVPTDIYELSLTSTSISQVSPDDFSGMTSLFNLYLDYNQLVVFPNIGDAKPSLELLKLTDNHISTVPLEATAGYGSLALLGLNGNELVQFPDLGDAKKTLNTISLSRNRISKIEREELQGFEQLSLLMLTSNKLTSLPDFHVLPQSIISVNVESNLITHYDPWSLETLLKFPALDFNGYFFNNRLKCTCQAIYLQQFLKDNSHLIPYSQAMCDSPSYLKNAVLYFMPVEQLVCTGKMSLRCFLSIFFC